MRLPLAIDAKAVAVKPSADDLTGVCALIVDDIKVNLDILSEQLSAWGVSSVAFGDPAGQGFGRELARQLRGTS